MALPSTSREWQEMKIAHSGGKQLPGGTSFRLKDGPDAIESLYFTGFNVQD